MHHLYVLVKSKEGRKISSLYINEQIRGEIESQTSLNSNKQDQSSFNKKDYSKSAKRKLETIVKLHDPEDIEAIRWKFIFSKDREKIFGLFSDKQNPFAYIQQYTKESPNSNTYRYNLRVTRVPFPNASQIE
jgi:hypothetical protein